MDNEKRLYVTRWRWRDVSTANQARVGGIMEAVCWPEKTNAPLHMVKRDGSWYYKCECTQKQYKKFTEIISGCFDTDGIDFDYKEE